MSKPKLSKNHALIRTDFPALQAKIYDKPLNYLDNAASAQKPQPVLAAMAEAYQYSYANVHRGMHYLADAATKAYENARAKLGRFINAGEDGSVIFTKNATEAVNLVAYSWGMEHIQAGDEIVLSIMEHHSNLVPWHFLRERLGAKLVFVPVGADGVLRFADFERALSKKTKLVTMTHMSNVLGTQTPIKNIIARAHADNIPVLVDGAQAAVHSRVDMQALNCDFYVLTGHKLYGPSGIGALYGKTKLLSAMRPFLGGGEMIETVSAEAVTYNAPPHRFEAGTPPIIEAIGLGAALDYLEALGRDAVYAYEAELSAYAAARLSGVKNLHMLGDAAHKNGIFSFNLADIHAADLAFYLDRQGIAVRAGTHCAEPLLARFGLKSVCRASLALYNSKAEIDSLAENLEKAQKFFR